MKLPPARPPLDVDPEDWREEAQHRKAADRKEATDRAQQRKVKYTP